MSDRKIVVDLLEKLNCYLIGDITSMIHVQPIGNCGGCGYPLLQTIISGSELCGRLELGYLKKDGGEESFAYFVKEYMPKFYHSLSTLYGVFRNTPAHMFITSVNIFKGGKKHMIVTNGVLEINIVELANDFIGAFTKFRTKLLSSDGKEIGRYFTNITKLQSKMLGEAKIIAKELEEDLEIQKRNYYNKIFNDNLQSVASSGVVDMYSVRASGASTMTEEQAKSLSKDEE